MKKAKYSNSKKNLISILLYNNNNNNNCQSTFAGSNSRDNKV